MMAYEPEYEVPCEMNAQTGIYTAPCPLCTFVATGSTEHGTMKRLYRHAEESHDERRRVGHA